jgi:calcium-dependent protein kinase
LASTVVFRKSDCCFKLNLMQIIAGCLSEEEITGLKEMFKNIDKDNSGTITLEELKHGLAKHGTKLSDTEIQQLMDAVSFPIEHKEDSL